MTKLWSLSEIIRHFHPFSVTLVMAEMIPAHLSSHLHPLPSQHCWSDWCGQQSGCLAIAARQVALHSRGLKGKRYQKHKQLICTIYSWYITVEYIKMTRGELAFCLHFKLTKGLCRQAMVNPLRVVGRKFTARYWECTIYHPNPVAKHPVLLWHTSSQGSLFTKKTPFYWYRDSHYTPETVIIMILIHIRCCLFSE